jgi:hypothetical protein
LSDNAEPKQLGVGVREFAILGQGQCVFVAPEPGFSGNSTEAHVYDDKTKSTWNVLEGVERLPDLPENMANKPYVEDNLRFRLVKSFGPPEDGRSVLALATHFRGDARSIPRLWGRNDEPPVPREYWRRGVLLTSTRERSLIQGLTQEIFEADWVWLHNSEKLIWGRIEWKMENGKEVKKLQVLHADLIPANGE